MQKWRIKNKEYISIYDKKRSKFPMRMKYVREYNQKRRINFKILVQEALGVKCVICKAPMKHYHEIYSKSHPGGYEYIFNHLWDFVPVCWQCHRGIHWLMSVCNKDWPEIYPILKSIV